MCFERLAACLLVAACSSVDVDPAPAVASAGDCAGADRLRISMSEAEVRALLGAPAKVVATPLQTRWRYPCGTAYFDAQTNRFVGYEP
jgi:hypothetical protein